MKFFKPVKEQLDGLVESSDDIDGAIEAAVDIVLANVAVTRAAVGYLVRDYYERRLVRGDVEGVPDTRTSMWNDIKATKGIETTPSPALMTGLQNRGLRLMEFKLTGGKPLGDWTPAALTRYASGLRRRAGTVLERCEWYEGVAASCKRADQPVRTQLTEDDLLRLAYGALA